MKNAPMPSQTWKPHLAKLTGRLRALDPRCDGRVPTSSGKVKSHMPGAAAS